MNRASKKQDDEQRPVSRAPIGSVTAIHLGLGKDQSLTRLLHLARKQMWIKHIFIDKNRLQKLYWHGESESDSG